jgi:hypothetical protein
VSRTRKDSRSLQGTILEIVKREDGTFDLFLNRMLDQGQKPESSLPAWLCVRFGFCGEEYCTILKEVNLNGRWTTNF